MEKKKILFISQAITPYLPSTEMSNISRYLPQAIQEKGKEVRVFTPRFGVINDRRNQLHEVIRLSGMNLIIDGNDHSLIIKVASIQSARMQVYFIDNEEYFKRRFVFEDGDGNFFADNDERMIFFCRGAIETVKKLRWTPDIIHCHGWMSSLVPLLIKKSYKHDPLFSEAKVIYSIYKDKFDYTFDETFGKNLITEGIRPREVKAISTPNFMNLSKSAIKNSDAIIQGNEEINEELAEYVKEKKKMFLGYQNPEEYIKSYSDFYDKILS